MNLYPEEMHDIADAIKTLSAFVESFSYSGIDVDLPEILTLQVRSRSNNKVIGYIDYTDDGAIGFITEYEGPVA